MYDNFIQDSQPQPDSTTSKVAPLPLAPVSLQSPSTLPHNKIAVFLPSTESNTPTPRCPQPPSDDHGHTPYYKVAHSSPITRRSTVSSE